MSARKPKNLEFYTSKADAAAFLREVAWRVDQYEDAETLIRVDVQLRRYTPEPSKAEGR